MKVRKIFAPHTPLPRYRATERHDHFNPRPVSGVKRKFGRLAVLSAVDPLLTCGFENCRSAKLHDLCSLENDQNKTHYRQRGPSHRRCHAWIRQNFLYENDHGKCSNPK